MADIVWKEMRKPAGVIVALLVGGILTYTRRFATLAPFLPFVVPFLVSLFTRSAGRIAARHRDVLLRLPAYRRDPAFIIDQRGRVVASAGYTEELFRSASVETVDDFLIARDAQPGVRVGGDASTDGVAAPAGTIDATRRTASEVLLATENDDAHLPRLYSPVTMRWYRPQLRHAPTGNDRLVWLDDVTEDVLLEERRQSLRSFTRELETSLSVHETSSDDDTRLASLLLREGYRAVMLARFQPDGSAEGVLYAADGRRHGPLTIPAGVNAPIVRSRNAGVAVWDDVDRWESRSAFEEEYRVLPDVASIIGNSVCNFANYHSGDVSIIAFDKTGTIHPVDLAVLESAADTAMTAFSLIDLARRADRRFVQSIHGVCAAAEFSDELTGAHIWRVNDYSRHLSATMGLAPARVRDIGTVAAMHDIGKVAIPHLIKLPRALTGDERREMEMHTVYGTQIIERMLRAAGGRESRLELACRISLHHHQHWNGTGYPGIIDNGGTPVSVESRSRVDYARLRPAAADEIPLEALIVSMADKYDALRSERQYKPAYDHDTTCALLKRDDRSGLSGRDVFGPRVFEAFQDSHDAFRAIYEAGRPERGVTTP
jgi:HD-GYP domain-containing protein (c-di-GMP phosphodiesterase class II)